MNISVTDPEYAYNHAIYYLSLLRHRVTLVLSPILYLNYIFILILSSLWAIYLTRNLLRNFRKEKIISKLRRNYPEYQWLIMMKNFKTNRIRDCFLLAICSSEFIMGGSIAAINILHALKGGGHDVKEIIK